MHYKGDSEAIAPATSAECGKLLGSRTHTPKLVYDLEHVLHSLVP